MGRHSAPDDGPDEGVDGAVDVAELDAGPPATVATLELGRHATGTPLADLLTEPVDADAGVAGSTDETADAPDPIAAAKPDEAAKPAKPRRGGAAHADLQMLRERPALRARCAAALIAPFVLYTIVLIAIGHLGAYLFWVWIPAILAGVVIGGLLDAAHKASGDAPAEPPGEVPAESQEFTEDSAEEFTETAEPEGLENPGTESADNSPPSNEFPVE
jgi:hypothetical protein